MELCGVMWCFAGMRRNVCGVVLCGVRSDVVIRHNMVWCGLVWCCVVRCGVRYDVWCEVACGVRCDVMLCVIM